MAAVMDCRFRAMLLRAITDPRRDPAIATLDALCVAETQDPQTSGQALLCNQHMSSNTGAAQFHVLHQA